MADFLMKNYPDMKRISQLFGGVQNCMYVGVIATFEKQFYLPPNGINLEADSHVISLSVSLLLGGQIFDRYL